MIEKETFVNVNFFIYLILTTPAMTVISRNAPFVLLVFIAALLALTNFRSLVLGANWSVQWPETHLIGSIAGLSLAFVLLSLFWSPLPARGFGALVQTSSAILATAICCRVLGNSIRDYRWLEWGFPFAIIAGCLIVLVELQFDSPIRQRFGADTENWRLNRAVVALALMYPLLCLIPKRNNYILIFFLTSLTLILTIFVSISEAAKISILMMISVLIISKLIPIKILAVICFSLIISTHIFAPVIGWAIYTLVPDVVFESVGYAEHLVRAQIWWAHAQVIIEAPFFGQGMQASMLSSSIHTGADPIISQGLDFGHPHNFSIQVWYELGLAGVILSTALMLILFYKILFLRKELLSIAAALLVGVWTVAFVSHGAWQHWWWALVGIISTLFVVLSKAWTIDRLSDRREAKAH